MHSQSGSKTIGSLLVGRYAYGSLAMGLRRVLFVHIIVAYFFILNLKQEYALKLRTDLMTRKRYIAIHTFHSDKAKEAFHDFNDSDDWSSKTDKESSHSDTVILSIRTRSWWETSFAPT